MLTLTSPPAIAGTVAVADRTLGRVEPATSEVRLAELVASLSLATDLGLGQPVEHVLRRTVIATRLPRRRAEDPTHDQPNRLTVR